jgi:hypothetical protein
MGWTVHYRAVVDGAIGDDDRSLLAEQTSKWSGELGEGSESYWWEILDAAKAAQIFGRYDMKTGAFQPAVCEPDKTYLWGFTKIQYSADQRADFCTMVAALKDLAAARPGWHITASDDYEYLRDTDPRTVADPAALLERDDS